MNLFVVVDVHCQSQDTGTPIHFYVHLHTTFSLTGSQFYHITVHHPIKHASASMLGVLLLHIYLMFS